MNHNTFVQLAQQIKLWGSELGFAHTGISDINLFTAEKNLKIWLEKKFHGEMSYMENHGSKRYRPDELIPQTIRVITVRMDYLNQPMQEAEKVLNNKNIGYISRYALGRDYHKVIRRRLQKLANKITQKCGPFGYRAFCDSGPVMEKPLAEKSEQGWIGKHTNIINKDSGSWFFLGELYTNLPLPIDRTANNHCGSCSACINICPTKAIVAPYILDARRCISYLTIELKGSIPVKFRKAIGNRIYGCDDCQLVCPWNRYAKISVEDDFKTRHNLDKLSLVDLFQWPEKEFNKKTEGSAMRRIGYIQWLRNIAIALGNAPTSKKVVGSLVSKKNHDSELVREHTRWALDCHEKSV